MNAAGETPNLALSARTWRTLICCLPRRTLWIAVASVRYGLPLVTANEAQFRVTGLDLTYR